MRIDDGRDIVKFHTSSGNVPIEVSNERRHTMSIESKLPKISHVDTKIGITLLTTSIDDDDNDNNSSSRTYAFGGRNKHTNEMLKDFMWCDTHDGYTRRKWNIQQRPMMTGRAYCAAAVVTSSIAASPYTNSNNNNSIVVVVTGGFSWDRQLCRYKETSSTEIFDDSNWIQGPNLNIARQNHSMAVLGNNSNVIVVLGGETSQGEPIKEIEVWDMSLAGSNASQFVVLPTKIPSNHNCTIYLYAVVLNNQRAIYYNTGRNQRGFISFDIHKLRSYINNNGAAAATTTTIATTPYNIMMPSSAASRPTAAATAPPQNEDDNINRKQPDKVSAISSQTMGQHQQQLGVGGGEPSSDMMLWLPQPPTLPEVPAALTLQDRHNAMKNYIQTIQSMQTNYQKNIEVSASKITQHYNIKRDQQIDLMRFHGCTWISQTQSLLENAAEQMKLQEEILRSKQSSADSTITSFLKQIDKDEFYDNIPSQLRCPLTLDIMTDPVIAADGNTYERTALEGWFQKSRQQQFASSSNTKYVVARSPLTGAELPNENYIPCHTLRNMCEEFSKRMVKSNNII